MKLAPEVTDTLLLVASQKIIDGDYQGALDMANDYIPKKGQHYYEPWKERLDNAMAGMDAQGERSD